MRVVIQTGTAPGGIEAGQIGVDLEKDFLGDVFGVGGVAGKAVAEAVDALVCVRTMTHALESPSMQRRTSWVPSVSSKPPPSSTCGAAAAFGVLARNDGAGPASRTIRFFAPKERAAPPQVAMLQLNVPTHCIGG